MWPANINTFDLEMLKMPRIPAICRSCQTIFPTAAIGVSGGMGGGVTVNMVNSSAGPCPNCGAMGDILDGTYNVGREFIELVSAPNSTVETLQRLGILFQRARDQNLDREEVAKAVEQEFPQYDKVAALIRANLWPFLTFLVALIALIYQLNADVSSNTYINDVDIDVEVIIEESFNSLYKSEPLNTADIIEPQTIDAEDDSDNLDATSSER